MTFPYRRSEGSLHLPIDSTGIKVESKGGNARKHGALKRRIWRKLHIAIYEKTLEIQTAEFTTSNVGDATMPSPHAALSRSFPLARTPSL